MVPFPRNEDLVGESQVASWLRAIKKGGSNLESLNILGIFDLPYVALGG
jgi:hypothetical protein